MLRVHERLVPKVLMNNVEGIGLENTPQHDLYENEIQSEETLLLLQKKLKPTPEVPDLYLVVEILLPREFKTARGHEAAQNTNAKVKQSEETM